MIFFPAEEKNKFLLTQLTVNFRVKKKMMEVILKITKGIIS